MKLTENLVYQEVNQRKLGLIGKIKVAKRHMCN